VKITRLIEQFNPRFFLVRFLVNAIAVAITAAVTPKIYFVDKSVWSWLLITVMLGLLNALLKPILQFLTLQFIFVTYGLVIVLVNTLILVLLSFLFPARFAVDNLLWALVGGLVLGLLSSFLESLLGLTMPIVPEEERALRRQLEDQARHVDWRVAANREAAQGEQTLAIEQPMAADAKAAEPAAAEPVVAESAVAEATAAESADAEPSTPGPDEGAPHLTELEAEPSDSVAMPPAEEALSESPEPAPEPGAEEKEEDRL
jgi:putative membrane protein